MLFVYQWFFLLLDAMPFFVPHFVYSTTDGYLGDFQFLAIVNRYSSNSCMQNVVCTKVLKLVG